MGDSFLLIDLALFTKLVYFSAICALAPQAAIILILDNVSCATPAASLSTSCMAAYLLTTNGVRKEYHDAMATSPLAVTKVSSQLKMHPIVSAVQMTVMAWISEDSRSDIPSWRILAVMVIIAVVCPGGSASSTEIGWRKRASR